MQSNTCVTWLMQSNTCVTWHMQSNTCVLYNNFSDNNRSWSEKLEKNNGTSCRPIGPVHH